MVAALQAPPRVRTTGPRRAPARVVPLRAVPDLREDEVVIVHRQPSPRATRSQRAAIYRRRRLIAAALGWGIVLTAAQAGIALGGSTTTPGRSPHPHIETVVVQPGDTLWSIANRVAPNADPRAVVDKLSAEIGSSDLQPGQKVSWSA
jgi:hypothetical protein